VQQGPAARDGCLLDDLETLPDKGCKVRRGKPGRKDFARGAAGSLDRSGCRRCRAPGLLLPGGLLLALFLLALLPRGPRIVVTGTGPAGADIVVVIVIIVVVTTPAVIVIVIVIVAAPAVAAAAVITVVAAPAIVAAVVVIAAAATSAATSASTASTAVIIVVTVIIIVAVVVVIGLRKGGGVTVDGDRRRKVQGQGQQKRQEKRLVSKVGHSGLLGRVDRRPCSTS
jgi:hypothetical protein